jgi:hypothetical protein
MLSGLSPPTSMRVGTVIVAACSGSNRAASSARDSRVMVWAAAMRACQAGSARYTANSSSGILTTSRKNVSRTASRSPSASSASRRASTPGGNASWSGFGEGQPSYSTSLRMLEVSAAPPNAHSPPKEWPSTSTADPAASATASTTAATSSNSRATP